MLKQSQPRLSQLASAVAVVLGGITLLPAAHAAAPAAGVSISNIASASYNDNTNNPQTVTSNEVRTTVLQVASFTLIADRTALASANSTVNLSHTLTNTGNGTDTFTIDLTNLSGIGVDDINLSNIAVYIDANGDGTADNTTNLIGQTVTLPAGQSVNLIVVGTTPLSALALQTAKLTISATTTTALAPSQQAAGATVSNTDTVTITAGAAIAVVKSASIAQITPTGTRTIKYTLRYTNSGNTAATEVAIKDQLPANVSYVPNSARWSTTGNTALTASADGDILEITPATGLVTDLLTFTIGSVPANSTGTVTFDVTVNAGAPVGDIINIGKFSYDPDTTGAGENPVTDVPTNSVPVEVLANRIGTINDAAIDAYSDAQRNLADPLKDDIQTIASIAQGATADFTAYVHNTGNLEQVFEVLLPTIPAGATVQLFKADGVTPLTNISGTSAVDVGPIPAGGTLAVRVLVKLPNNVSGNNNGNGFVTEVKVQPVGATTTDSTTLIITEVLAARADLHNSNVAIDNNLGTDQLALGEGVTGANVIDTKSTTPGNSVTFNLGVFNGSTTSDNFNLSVGGLPAGWTVVFLDASNNAVTNTGNITTATQSNFTAVVTPPVGTSVNDYPLDFVITSPVSGLTDTMRDVVKVTEFRQLSLVPNRQGQVAPGGTILYSHTLTNNGNIVEGATAGQLALGLIQASGTGTFAGNVTIAVDLDNNGLIGANETLTGTDLNQRLTAGLAKGASATILVQVQAPAQALPGQIDSSTVTITANNAVNGVAAPASVQIIDTTTVTSGQIRLVKTQAVDALCDGTADSAYGQGVIAAKPGQCVVYRIVATNEGNAAVTNVVITDATPAFTKVSTVATNTPSVPANISSPAVGATGTVTNNVGSLAPAATAQVDFGVKIDQ